MSAIAVATFSPAAPHEPAFRELCVSKHPDAPASHLYGAEPAATVVFIPTSPKSPAIIFMSSALPWQTIAFPLSFTTLSNRSAVAAEMCAEILYRSYLTAPIDTASASAASASHATPASS